MGAAAANFHSLIEASTSLGTQLLCLHLCNVAFPKQFFDEAKSWSDKHRMPRWPSLESLVIERGMYYTDEELASIRRSCEESPALRRAFPRLVKVEFTMKRWWPTLAWVPVHNGASFGFSSRLTPRVGIRPSVRTFTVDFDPQFVIPLDPL